MIPARWAMIRRRLHVPWWMVEAAVIIAVFTLILVLLLAAGL